MRKITVFVTIATLYIYSVHCQLYQNNPFLQRQGFQQQPYYQSGSSHRHQNIVYPDFIFPGSNNHNNYPSNYNTQQGNTPSTQKPPQPKPTFAMIFTAKPTTPRPTAAPNNYYNPRPNVIQANRLNERISQTKCFEYSSGVKKKFQFSQLTLGPSSFQEDEVTECEASTGLIVGGAPAKTGEFPHMAAIGYPSLNGGIAFKCGGSLISEFYVLTAAHCRKTDRTRPTMVRLGDLNLKNYDYGMEIDIPIDKFIAHESYNKETRENDIAVIRLTQQAAFNKYIRPACLQQTDAIEKNTATATGWGYTEIGGQTSDILQKVELKILPNQHCDSLYNDDNIFSSQICGGVLEGGKDTCGGDSGGPLQITTLNECIFSIIGITSYGSQYCGSRNSPGIYTRVSSHLDWIEQKVWG